MQTIKTVKGYTAQARYYAANMALQAGTDEWLQAGFALVANAAKPVFVLKDGRKVVIVDGRNHLTVYIMSADDLPVYADEDALWAACASVRSSR